MATKTAAIERGGIAPLRAVRMTSGSNSIRLDTLLAVCQLVNSSFPTGSFSHSYGLETLIQTGEVGNAESLEKACRSWLRYSLCTSDGVAAALAFRAARGLDMARLAEIDRRIACMRLTRESRTASSLTGKAFAAAAAIAIASPLLEQFCANAAETPESGQHPVIFGVVMAAADLDEDEGIAMLLQSSFTSLVGVGARLIPLGQAQVQGILTRARDLIVDCTRISQSRSIDQMSAAATRLEIASMQHERQESRLCMS